MKSWQRNALIVVFAGAWLAGCSGSRSRDIGLRDDRSAAQRGDAGIRYYGAGRSDLSSDLTIKAPTPTAVARPNFSPFTDARPSGPLQRFAAMPRFRPQAPHVRQNESTCLASGVVRETRFVRADRSVGSGACYVTQPFEMRAAAGGAIPFEPAATLRCQMVPSVETWVAGILRPAARRYFGSDVAKLRIAASYSCRTRNNQSGAKLSEHGRANAIDISAIHLADGRVVTVRSGWRGSADEQAFLRYIHRGACEHFSTVLGPNADRYHHDHFHFDLASHGRAGTYRVCK